VRGVDRFSAAVSAAGSIGLWESRMGVAGADGIRAEDGLEVCEPVDGLEASKVDIAPRLER
jgi:hypothetical protein